MLQGTRVRLRSIAPEGLSRLWTFNNDIEVEVAGGGAPPMPQSLARLQAEYDQAASKGGRDGMTFGIEVEGLCIGQCALFGVNWVARTAELGITIGDKKYWGQGHGRESVNLLVHYAFHHPNLHKIWLNVHASNERAIRDYSSCGFVEEGRLRAHVWSNGQYDDLVVMGVLRSEWQQPN